MVVSNNYINEKARKSFRTQFMGTDFFILLLALHQRHVLLNMAWRLARHSRDTEKVEKKVSQLRTWFMEFTIRSWFSQITNDDAGMERYRKWQDIFDNKTIFEEVSNQIEAYDNFNQAQMSKAIEILSAVFFPLLAFGSIYSFLDDFNKMLPEKVLGHQVVYIWIWLGVFSVCQFIWLRWLYNWKPVAYIKGLIMGGISKVKRGIMHHPVEQQSSNIEDRKYFGG